MIHSFPFILLRSPVQSLQKAYAFSGGLSPLMEEGLYLASAEFWTEYQKRDKAGEKDREKIDRSFAKYWIRSCMRPTPYGTFAGSALIDITPGETKISLQDSRCHIRRSRLDMNYLTGIIQTLAGQPDICRQLRFFVNNSLYELPSSFRYIEYSIRNNIRHYELCSIVKTDYLKKILHRAKEGATLEELIGLLAGPGGEDEEEARDLIMAACASQLLIPGIEPCVTGDDPLDQLISRLEELQQVDSILSSLKNIRQLLHLPREGVGALQEIGQALNSLDIISKAPKNTIQTDLYLSLSDHTINDGLVESIVQQVSDLFLLSRPNTNKDLQYFKEKFHEKFEEMEVPLAIALDSELGIGYSGVSDLSVGEEDLVSDLQTESPATPEKANTTYLTDFALLKYHDYLQHGRPHIVITPQELEQFRPATEKFLFPTSLFLMGSLLKKEGRLDPSHFWLDVTVLSGPSAGNLLGRFTHGDEALLALTRQILQQEEKERPDVIFAEIAHLPQARIGNVLLRPILRKYEIPYVGRSGASTDDQLSIDDLMVSIRQGEVILRSRRYNKRVIPRLTTAHNYSQGSLPVYKFLCDLQTQGLASPNAWDWGALSSLKHLPRVTYKNLILKKARWKVDPDDIKDLPKDPSAYIGYFKDFCRRTQIPEQVIYHEGDSKLLIDLRHPKGIHLFLHYLKRSKQLTLEEFLFTEDNCVVTNIHDLPYTNEVIIPLYRTATAGINTIPGALKEQPVKRKFSPNSEWIYFKVYCGPKTAETFLSTTILEFIEDALKKEWFEKFFFIRYRDEGPHLRIRFYNTDIDKQSYVQHRFTALLEPFLENGAIHKIVLDTYCREIERYGPDLVQEAEALFFHDSLAILRFISLLEEGEGEKYRLLFALRGIDAFLNDFSYTLQDKIALLTSMQRAFFSEFGAAPALQKQLDEKYRSYQQAIFTHMNPEKDAENGIEDGVAVFSIRSAMNLPVIETIYAKLAGPIRMERLSRLLPSYIHMFMNRLFIGNQRKYELVVYHFLKKYYTSQLAITQKAARSA